MARKAMIAKYQREPKFPTRKKYRCGLGIAIVSTSQGIISGKKCEETGVGGEVLCYIW